MYVTISIDSDDLGDINARAECRYLTKEPKEVLQDLIDEALGKIRRAYELDPPKPDETTSLVLTARELHKSIQKANTKGGRL